MAVSRRDVLMLVAAVAASAPTGAQRSGPRRVGLLSYLDRTDPLASSLREGLRELGHVEGSSFVVIARFGDGDFKRLPAMVDELAAERLDVLVARGPSIFYTLPVRERIPVVFAFSGDPVAAGFAETLGKPGRNMTGITFMALELSAKRVEVLKELVPAAKRVALLSNPEHAGELEEYRVTEDTAHRLGMSIVRYLVRDPQELAGAYSRIALDRPDAMIVFPDSLTLVRRADIAAFAARERIPTIYGWTEFAVAGGLASYGAGVNDNFKSLAKFVDKVLKGESASEIPIEQVGRISLTLNAKTAKAMGFAVPGVIALRADRIIE